GWRESDGIGLLRIDPDLRIVERPRVDVVHVLPRLSAVGRAIETVRRWIALERDRARRDRRRFRERVDDLRIAARDRETDAALRTFGVAVALDLRPRRPAIG